MSLYWVFFSLKTHPMGYYKSNQPLYEIVLRLEASFHKGLFGPSVTMAFNKEKWGFSAGQVILTVAVSECLIVQRRNV